MEPDETARRGPPQRGRCPHCSSASGGQVGHWPRPPISSLRPTVGERATSPPVPGQCDRSGTPSRLWPSVSKRVLPVDQDRGRTPKANAPRVLGGSHTFLTDGHIFEAALSRRFGYAVAGDGPARTTVEVADCECGRPRLHGDRPQRHRGHRTVEQAATAPVRLATLDDEGPTGQFEDEDGPVPW